MWPGLRPHFDPKMTSKNALIFDVIFDGILAPFGEHFGTKMLPKSDQKSDPESTHFLEEIWA